MTFLQRYVAGDREGVWADLVALGDSVRAPGHLEDARAVARETMRRARHNVKALHVALPSVGWVFAEPERAYEPPARDVGAQLDEAERLVGGPLPLSLRAWYEEVGTVDFRGHHPDWPSHGYPDALVSIPLAFSLEDYVERRDDPEFWRFRQEHYVEWCFAPDYFHKDDTSGGMPYSLIIPSDAADTELLFEPHETTFVGYLRTCFTWAGCPGWDGQGRGEYATTHYGESPPSALLDIAARLLVL